ncbi:C6 zinc finger domain-containing protein [Rhexocercosporidium sp. MPI-PUGE-AT-0058]|nr:C6 zinc finger domain-containing protein [Rhexocercosporidium sp. MPI-PUGE-AT-0058]
MPATSSRQRQPDIVRSPEHNDFSVTNRVQFSLDLEAGHRLSTDEILQWPVFDELLSTLQRFGFVDLHGSEAYTYLNDLLTQSDSVASNCHFQSLRELSTSDDISSEGSDIEPLIDHFFNRINIKNPIVTRQDASQYCQRYCAHRSLSNLENCLVLLMCALGAVSMEFDPSDVARSPSSSSSPSSRLASLRLGACYFVAAEKCLGSAISSVSSLAIQCLCLAGIFHMYLIKPMHALRMFHAAGSSLQILASTSAGSAEGKSQVYSSLFWTCYKSEREILAEIPISAPALRQPGWPDSYPLSSQPASLASDMWASHEEDSWYFFLSEIALRRITDQVADVVCKYIDARQNSHDSLGIKELIPIVAEFERQAETFREHLPPSIQFPDVPQLASTEWQQYSRGRFYRVLELMHRPFLFTAIHEPDCSAVIRILAEKGLFNALRYLQHSHTSHRHHGTWLMLRNELKAASLLLAASRSEGLNMPPGWEAAITKVLATFDYWALEFPSCKTYSSVVLTLANSSLAAVEEHGPINFI